MPPIEAVLFDMDGVVTRTAEIHAAAWKRMFDEFLARQQASTGIPHEPFDIRGDYLAFVDGKPRYDGVSGFLSARGIRLPYGDPVDGVDRLTICGLGNRKDSYFRDWLATHTVPAYPGTIALCQRLRDAGIKCAVFSASRNARAVLRGAGVTDLFDVTLDGDELAALGLPGKPDPAMLREAATRLGVAPQAVAVIEDATVGIEAAVRGAFAQAIGIDRGGNAAALRAAGASLIIGDAAELTFEPATGLRAKTLRTVPVLGTHESDIDRRLQDKRPVVFLDYDGTLTPIVPDPAKAFLGADMRTALAALAACCTVAVVSGRDLKMLRGFVELDSLYYAGSHGFEISGPAGWRDSMEKGLEFLPALAAAEASLRDRLAWIAGHEVERKRFSIAVHYRHVAKADLPSLTDIVDTVLAEQPGLRKGLGKKVFELRPDIAWDKGEAVLWLLDRLGLDHTSVLPIYVGDDITDEDAFRVLAGRGLAVAVRDGDERMTAADYALAGTEDVRRFLGVLTSIVMRGRRHA